MDLSVHLGKPAFIVLYLLYICILVFQINIFQFNSIRLEKKFPSRTDTVRDLYSLAQCPRVTALRLVKNTLTYDWFKLESTCSKTNAK